MSKVISWRNSTTLFLIALFVTLPASLYAQDDGDKPVGDEPVCDAIVFVGAWSRPAVALDGTGNGAGYGILVNLGAEDDRLVSASSEAASVVELHEVVMTENDVMQMRPLEDGMLIPAGGFALLEPGGRHIMYFGLTQDFVRDESLTLDLTFENAEPLRVSYTVADESPTGEDTVLAISGDISGCQPIGFYGAWATPSTDDSHASAIYGLFLNLSDDAYQVVGLSTDVADMTHFADVEADDPANMMVEGLDVPTNGFVLLSDDGLHIDLIGIADGLAPEDMLELTLTYGDDTQQNVMVMVQMLDMDMDMGDMDDQAHEDDMDMDSEEE